MDRGNIPNDVGVDAVVLVAQLVTDGNDVGPGHVRLLVAKVWRQMIDRLGDNEHGVLHGIAEGEVAFELG